MTSTTLVPTRRDLNGRIADVLWDAYGRASTSREDAARRIADRIGCGLRTALAWLKAESAPDFWYTMQLLRHCPEFAAFVMEQAEIAPDLDPRLAADILEFAKQAQRLHKAMEARR